MSNVNCTEQFILSSEAGAVTEPKSASLRTQRSASSRFVRLNMTPIPTHLYEADRRSLPVGPQRIHAIWTAAASLRIISNSQRLPPRPAQPSSKASFPPDDPAISGMEDEHGPARLGRRRLGAGTGPTTSTDSYDHRRRPRPSQFVASAEEAFAGRLNLHAITRYRYSLGICHRIQCHPKRGGTWIRCRRFIRPRYHTHVLKIWRRSTFPSTCIRKASKLGVLNLLRIPRGGQGLFDRPNINHPDHPPVVSCGDKRSRHVGHVRRPGECRDRYAQSPGDRRTRRFFSPSWNDRSLASFCLTGTGCGLRQQRL